MTATWMGVGIDNELVLLSYVGIHSREGTSTTMQQPGMRRFCGEEM